MSQGHEMEEYIDLQDARHHTVLSELQQMREEMAKGNKKRLLLCNFIEKLI